jgi:DNA-binding CsgD family transcriptional regulator
LYGASRIQLLIRQRSDCAQDQIGEEVDDFTMNRAAAGRQRSLSSGTFRRGGDLFRYLALDGDLPELVGLTDAERDVVRLLIDGEDNRAIAGQRGASVNTVGNQIASIFAKLGVSSRFELVELVCRLGHDPPLVESA